MNFEYRFVHIDMLALPISQFQEPLTSEEASLAIEFKKECAVTKGVVLVTNSVPGRRFNVVFGFQVLRAAKRALIDHIPCIVAESFSNAFIELISGTCTQASLSVDEGTKDQLSEAIKSYELFRNSNVSYRNAEQVLNLGKRSSLYTNSRLATKLHPKVQSLLHDGKISRSAARSISYIAISSQPAFASKAIANNWTVREIELARSSYSDAPVEKSFLPDLSSFAKDLEDFWGGPVSLTPKTKHTGSICFDFYNLKDVSAFCNRLSKLTGDYHINIKAKHRYDNLPVTGTIKVSYTCIDTLDKLKDIFKSNPMSSLSI